MNILSSYIVNKFAYDSDSNFKTLGNINLHTTQHYAKILDLKVSNDMKALKEKFGNGNQMKLKKSAG